MWCSKFNIDFVANVIFTDSQLLEIKESPSTGDKEAHYGKMHSKKIGISRRRQKQTEDIVDEPHTVLTMRGW